MTQLTLVKINQGKVIQYSFDKSKESKVVQLFLFKQFLAWGFQIETSDNDTNQRQESQHNLKNSDKIYRLDYIVPINAIWLNESPDGYDNDYGSVLEIITPERNLLIALTHKMNFMHKIFDVMVQYFHIDIQDIISKQYRLLKFFFTNQIVFEGEMLNGKSKGKAKLIYPNGTVYDGGVIAGLKEGPGQITFFCNDTFSGNWTKNKVSGQFTLKYVSGNMLSTSYSHKNPQEYGEFVSPSAGNYQGNFSDFKFHGKGSFTFSNGDKYIGSFQRNMRHDYGGLVCKDGSEYAGYWVNDMRSGKEGTQIYPNGDVYEGEWLNNLRHGNGKFSSHKTTYYGEWKNDLKHGKGKLFYSRDNVKYFGQFENGLRSGNGRFINGNWRYIGEWERNYPNGKGELIICNKKIVENEEENKNNLVKKYSGIFRFGKPYDENMKCIEKSLQFEGQIEFGVKKGYGKIIFPNGNKIISIFNSGLPSQEEELSIHFSENQNKKESTILKYTNTRVEFEQNSLDNERSNLLQKLARQVNTIEPINESIICWLSPPEHEQTLEWF
ncbi:hypothetical protein M0811_00013 [Anaeramoeba ignava]|uniref:MORN repeat protein n=1 Tax=Anaeramoeba ignava TaxID=1746090 RepID=A0A9Q0LQ51_ANAIG|nr:hypothetical protein M0811_00013 [Anaeramoeba ignava]